MEKFSKYWARRQGYVPLPVQYATSSQKITRRMLLVATIGLLSLILNIVFVCKALSKGYLNPLDDYQKLKHYPLTNASFLTDSASASNGNAVVTTLYTDEYAPAVAALGHSLNKVNTTARLILLYLPSQVSAQALCIASSSGFVPTPVERVSPPHNGTGITPRFIDQYTKLTLWKLDALPEPVRALVYIDADCLVTGNFDELFRLPFPFAAVPDVWTTSLGWLTEFNAGVMFVRPDSAFFHAMLEDLGRARYPRAAAEQSFLNQYFASDVVRLPYVYNGNLAIKARAPSVWEGIRDEMRIIHYTLVKPFVSKQWSAVSFEKIHERVEEASREWNGIFREEMTLWQSVWEEARITYAQQLHRCLA